MKCSLRYKINKERFVYIHWTLGDTIIAIKNIVCKHTNVTVIALVAVVRKRGFHLVGTNWGQYIWIRFYKTISLTSTNCVKLLTRILGLFFLGFNLKLNSVPNYNTVLEDRLMVFGECFNGLLGINKFSFVHKIHVLVNAHTLI